MEIAKIRRIIEQQLADLAQQVKSTGDSTATVTLDQSRVGRLSRMDALQSQAMQTEILRRTRLQIAELERTLKRLDHEDFGYCEGCFEEIPIARLKLNPAVRMCIRCTEKSERQ